MRIFLTLLGILFLFVIAGTGGAFYVLHKYGQGIADHHQLAEYEPPVTTRVHAANGALLEEFASERRVFVPYDSIPRRVINAFLAAEDKNFYSHWGVDIPSVVRAIVTNVKNIGSGRRLVGASTITQQVAKNFLLTNEVSFDRKIKEAILAFRIEKAFSKDRILELYLNEIFLGNRSYGVAMAAQRYFDKSLSELSIAEAAYLAVLPKAPSRYHPVRHKERALIRRNWVIGRMLQDGHITQAEADAALASPLEMAERDSVDSYEAPYFVQEVRRELLDRYGENTLELGGLSVRTSLDPRLQTIATNALQEGLHAYDKRWGYRGPAARIENFDNWKDKLAAVTLPRDVPWPRALVLAVNAQQADIGFEDGSRGVIPINMLGWARPRIDTSSGAPSRGDTPTRADAVMSVGDVIFAVELERDSFDKPVPPGTYGLRQIPQINGGLVALDPHTGRILAMAGGYSFEASQFNRAVQAKRQPGSSFKPFIYLSALDDGYTPTTLILDAPFVLDQGAGLGKWKPANYTRVFYGPSTMRLGIEKSRNLMTVRLAQTIGMEKVEQYGQRFGIFDELPHQLSMSLGAGETDLLSMTAAYGMLVNGGKRIEPSLIDYIQDRSGVTKHKHDVRACDDCLADAYDGGLPPQLPDTREQLTDPKSAYQMVSMLHGVVERGSGRRISDLPWHLGGKTGTTNLSRDTWFVGFSPDLAVGVFAGRDTPTPLGRRETGSSVAAPIFKEFMRQALEGTNDIPFRVPDGIRLSWVDAQSGVSRRGGDEGAILEAFKPGQEPQAESAAVLDGGYNAAFAAPSAEAGGIY